MDSGIYVLGNLNTTKVVVLQVLSYYDIMFLKWASPMSENCLKKSQSCVASPYLLRQGMESYNPKLKTNFEMGTAAFFEDIEFRRRNKVKDCL